MPPEPTISKTRMKKRSTSRRDGRDRDVEDYRFDGGHSRELELKRSRGKSADIQLPLYCLTDPLLGLLGLLLNSLTHLIFWCGRSLFLTYACLPYIVAWTNAGVFLRNLGEVSCAECRRLKIKCDKQIPCTSCQRRGCAALCPNGSLSTGQGTRFVLAATEHLHRRIGRLSARIRQLEDALASLHAQHSDDPHPLLDPRANVSFDDDEKEDEKKGVGIGEGVGDMGSMGMSVDKEPGRDRTVDGRGADEDDRNRKSKGGRDVIDAFGTLSISDHGISRFFGPTGGSESLLIANLRKEDEEDREKDRQDDERSRSRSLDLGLRASNSPLSMDGRDRDNEGHASSSVSPAMSNNTTSMSSVGTGVTSLFSVGNGPNALGQPQRQSNSRSPVLFSSTFPFTPLGLPTKQIMTLIQDYLPERRRAGELVDVYYAQLAWLFRGVGRDQAEEMIRAIYGALGKGAGRAGERGWESDDDEKNPKRNERGRSRNWGGDTMEGGHRFEEPLENDYQGPHDLALLFMMFAASALVEPEPGKVDEDEDEQETNGQTGTQMQWNQSQTQAGGNMIIRIGDEDYGGGNAPGSHSSSAANSPPFINGQPAANTSTHAAKSSAARATALADHYHQLAQAALSLQPVLEKPSIVTIQVLHLMSIYNAMAGNVVRRDDDEDVDDGDDERERGGRSKSRGRNGRGKSKSVGREKSRGRRRRKDDDKEASMEMTWSLITMAAHLSQTIGLHRDSERWGLSPKMVQRRRVLFWDLFVADVWTSLNTGRPPSFSLAYIDCAFPASEDTGEKDGKTGLEEGQQASTGNAGGKASAAFGIWQFRFAAECVAEVTARTLTAEAPTYATIMDLDRKVREFPLPEGFGPATSGSNLSLNSSPFNETEEDLAMSFQRCVMDHIRETVLMYIHRSFFAQAIIEHPANPLKSQYAPSFLAAYRASTTILKSIREQFAIWPIPSARFWTMWTFAFTAAVVFGTVVTRGPRSPLAPQAMTELEQACILFSRVAIYSKRAEKALPILTNLREKARLALAGSHIPSPMADLSLSHSALSRLSTNASPLSGVNGELWNVPKNEPEDELSIFAGHTRFVSSRPRSQNALLPAPGDSASTSRDLSTSQSVSPTGIPRDVGMGIINGGSVYSGPEGHPMSISGPGSTVAMQSLPVSIDTMPGPDGKGYPSYQTHSRRASQVRGPYDVDVDMDMNMNLENTPMRYQPTVQSMDGYAHQQAFQPHSSQPHPSGPSIQLYDDQRAQHQYQLPPPPRAMQPPFHSQHDQPSRPHTMSASALDGSGNLPWIRQPPSREDTIRPAADYSSRDYPDGYYREDSQQSRDYLPRENYRRDYSQHREPLHSQGPSNPPIAIPPTISIPPAPMSASQERTSSPVHFNYSYDRSSSGRPGLPSRPSIPEVNISAGRSRTLSRPSVPRVQQSTSPVRLTQPQYGPPSAGPGQIDMDTDVYYPRTSRVPSHHEPHQHYSYLPTPARHDMHAHPPSHHGPGGSGVPGNPALADLGLAARDSRLDERWSSFMADSGILDDVNYGNGRR